MKKSAALSLLTITLAACQGSIGSTPPVNAPQLQANQNGQVNGVGGPGASRAKTTEATVKYYRDMATINFPTTEGYGVKVVITSTPVPSPSASASGKVSGSPSPSASASASASASPSATPHLSPTPKPTKKPAVTTITLKLSVYPEEVPQGPTPDPEASPEPTPIQDRTALLRAYFKSPGSLTLPSLDSFKFTVPQDEIITGRGFSIAFFVVPDKGSVAQPLVGGHKDGINRIAYTTTAVVNAKEGVISAGPGFGSLAIAANQGYEAVLYGDPEAVAGPGTSQTGKPSPLPFGQTPSPTPFGMTPAPTPFGQTPSPVPLNYTPTPLPFGYTPTPLPTPQGFSNH